MTKLINLDNLEVHLKTMVISDWEKLFRLIPKMENNRSFGKFETPEKNEEDI